MNKNEILIELSESDKTKFGKEDFAHQTVPQKVFSAIWAAESEINNGGFTQYFSNSSAESAPFVVTAMETIGAPKTATICRSAIEIAFPGGMPTTAEAANQAAESFSEDVLDELEALDQEFCAYPHDLTELLFAYVMEHPEEFGKLPQLDGE